MAAPVSGDVFAEIRKLRKKLRQIENLQRLHRDLTQEEEVKVSKKQDIRAALLDLLVEAEDQEVSVDTSYNTTATSIANSSYTSDREGEDEGSGLALSDKYSVEEDNEDVEKELGGIGAGDQRVSSSEQNHGDNPGLKRKNNEGAVQSTSSSSEANVETTPKKKSKKAVLDEATQKKKEYEERLTKLRRNWKGVKFGVRCLEGHNDIVNSLAVSGELLLTGSRDTSVKLWNICTCLEVKNFGGHTGSVTAVLLLSKEESKELNDQASLNLDEDDQIAISASLDCHIRIWAVSTGQTVKSIYTYNPVTCLGYLPTHCRVVSTSDGGKLDIWDLDTGSSVQSLRAHDGGITCLQIHGDEIITASSDGLIKVYHLRDGSLHLIFESEDVKTVTGDQLTWRHIRSLTTANQSIYYGDDGFNIKVLKWKNGLVHKLKNHLSEFGSTDALSLHNQLLLAGSYDLDSGLGSINVWSQPEEAYLTTINDADTSRVTCLKCAESNGTLRIISGGEDLKVWERLSGVTETRFDEEETCVSQYIPQLSQPAENSDVESEVDSDSGGEDNMSLWNRLTTRRNTSKEGEENEPESRWWCNLL